MALKFRTAAGVEQILWQMRLADYPRALNRARINSLFNGDPPYTQQQAEINNIGTNVNFLDSTVIDHAARRQVWNAMCVPNPIFTVDLDYGPTWRKREWGNIITREINKPLVKGPNFLDLRDGVGASMVLHGIGPTIWEDDYNWMPTEVGVEDVLIPSNTLRSLKNLPFFGVYRQYTAPTFYKMTHGPKVDKAWNMDVVDACIKWIDEQSRMLLGTNWPEVWSPEKMEERFKQDSGLYASDAVPTIDCYDFYFWNDNGKQSGWNRRMVLDAWGQPGVGTVVGANADAAMNPNNRRFNWSKDKFLYDSGDRVVADSLEKIIHFQFGDASAVAPFRYHSVRSLGFLMYAVCHLQNRLRCRFTDSVFEALMQYFRINNPADMDRLQKIDLVDKGILPEGLQFVRPEERWQVNEGLVMKAFELNRQSMQDASSSFRQDYQNEEGEETATRTMAKVNSAAQLVGSMVNRIYAYEQFRYQEICRRFTIKRNENKDIKKFRVECLKAGVPQEALNSDRWNIKLNRVIGGGDKTLQVAIVDRLMSVRGQHQPEAQAEILRLYDATISDDWDLANRLNPQQQSTSESVHDTQLVFGALMAGSFVTPKKGLNAIEVVGTMLQLMAATVERINQNGGVGTPEDIMGLQLAAQYTVAFINQLASDQTQKPLVKEMGDALGKIMNDVKAFAQRQQQMAQKAAEQNDQNGEGAKVMADIQAKQMKAQIDAKNSEAIHAQITAQKQLAFEADQKREQEKHQMQMAQEAAKTTQEIESNRLTKQNS